MDYDEDYYDRDYEDYEDYEDYDWSLAYDCPDVSLANVLRKWVRRLKGWIRTRLSREDVSDIPF